MTASCGWRSLHNCSHGVAEQRWPPSEPPPGAHRSPNHLPGANVATYYGQRASHGGLIISEATAICPEAHG
jgi:hypothetical protein